MENNAASRIQASWRGHKTRRSLVAEVRENFEKIVRSIEVDCKAAQPAEILWSRSTLCKPVWKETELNEMNFMSSSQSSTRQRLDALRREKLRVQADLYEAEATLRSRKMDLHRSYLAAHSRNDTER